MKHVSALNASHWYRNQSVRSLTLTLSPLTFDCSHERRWCCRASLRPEVHESAPRQPTRDASSDSHGSLTRVSLHPLQEWRAQARAACTAASTRKRRYSSLIGLSALALERRLARSHKFWLVRQHANARLGPVTMRQDLFERRTPHRLPLGGERARATPSRSEKTVAGWTLPAR